MKIAALYNPLTISAQTWETLDDVARRLAFNEVGAAPVFEHGDLVGMISERDLARAMGDGVDPSTTTVSDYMTEEPAVCSPDTEGRQAATLMLQLGVRHLPVMSRDRLVGVVSIRDLLQDLFWASEAS